MTDVLHRSCWLLPKDYNWGAREQKSPGSGQLCLPTCVLMAPFSRFQWGLLGVEENMNERTQESAPFTPQT